MSKAFVVTCVYCGHAYPSETPTSAAPQLTEHIRTCEQHPMRAVERKLDLLRKAAIGMVGVERPDELDAVEAVIRVAQIPNSDRVNLLNLIDAIRQTNPRA